MDANPALLRQRQRLIQELQEVQAALAADQKSQGVFASLPPGKAIRKFLAEEGKPCDRSAIIWSLIAGNANVGSKEPDKNISRAIDVNLQLGLLREINGRIGLAEWHFMEPQQGRAADPRVRLVLRKMHTELDRAFSLTELAESVQLSPSRLSRLFQSEIGINPSKYLRQIKLRVFRSMLQKSNLKQKQILAIIGITDRSHFSKRFKEIFRKSPAALRKQKSRAAVPLPQ